MGRYLVTGGCGFIGAALSRRLIDAGHRVRILDDLSVGRAEDAPRGAELIVGDVADAETALRAMDGAEGCFHLAAIASVERCTREWLAGSRVNLSGTLAVFEAAHRLGDGRPLPVVYVSSAAIYGEANGKPLTEGAPPQPISPYGADKLASEMHARAAARIRGARFVGIRAFNVYGGHQRLAPDAGVIVKFASAMAAGNPIELHGDGQQRRDFVHVDDVTRALAMAMEGIDRAPPVFNVCTGKAVTLEDVVAKMARAFGAKARVRRVAPRPGDIRVSVGDPALAHGALGFVARIDLDTGLERLAQGMRRQPILAAQ